MTTSSFDERSAENKEHERRAAVIRQSEAGLRESDQRFRQMADNAPVMIWMTEPDASCSFLSKSWYDFTGHTAETGLGFGWVEAIHPDDREHAKSAFLSANEGRESFRAEYRLRRSDGEYRWTINSGAPHFDSQGEFLGYIGSVLDITERKLAEAAMIQMSAIVESSDDAIISKDLNGIIASWNRGAEKLYGYTALEAIGQPVTILIPSDRMKEEPIILDRIRRGEQVDHYETKRRRKDGSEIDISLTVSPVRDGTGKVIGASKIARDITERKRIEIEREELLLKESAARAEAEAANRSKDEFVAIISHELRSPLNAILGYNSMLREKPDDAAHLKHISSIIERNARTQLQLIEDLLDTTRIISGKMRLDIRSVELAEVIASAIDTVYLAARSKGVIIIPMLAPEAGQITGDPDRLQQVVWNLLSNAVKFTPAGGRVQVELQRGPSDVRILVRDTGEGVSPDLLPYIFDRFKQGDSSTSRRLGGLGLGLTLVKHLVELHGGRVAVESPGKGLGATFIVSLPLRAVLAKDGEVVMSRSTTTERRLDDLRVLIVDDEEEARELVAVTLALCGAQVVKVESAAAALAALELRDDGRVFDIIVSDIRMPDEDGLNLMRKVRRLAEKRLSRIPAVALTAHNRFEDRMQALQAGFQMHVAKPVDADELMTVIASLTGRLEGPAQKPKSS